MDKDTTKKQLRTFADGEKDQARVSAERLLAAEQEALQAAKARKAELEPIIIEQRDDETRRAWEDAKHELERAETAVRLAQENLRALAKSGSDARRKALEAELEEALAKADDANLLTHGRVFSKRLRDIAGALPALLQVIESAKADHDAAVTKARRLAGECGIEPTRLESRFMVNRPSLGPTVQSTTEVPRSVETIGALFVADAIAELDAKTLEQLRSFGRLLARANPENGYTHALAREAGYRQARAQSAEELEARKLRQAAEEETMRQAEAKRLGQADEEAREQAEAEDAEDDDAAVVVARRGARKAKPADDASEDSVPL